MMSLLFVALVVEDVDVVALKVLMENNVNAHQELKVEMKDVLKKDVVKVETVVVVALEELMPTTTNNFPTLVARSLNMLSNLFP